jgi:adenine C2-methylase RlmN of 23S rRNA A2503 and tRNA A37
MMAGFPPAFPPFARTSMKTLKSKLDESVNFIFDGNFPGYIEARYVRRSPKYFACYLSSQTGCNQGCRMCHLTATKQTKNVNITLEQYLEQTHAVFNHYDNNCLRAEIVHFNFMARGEAFNNQEFLAHGKELFDHLGADSVSRDLFPRFLISTIMPTCIAGLSLSKIFPAVHPEIYYSIYSVNSDFRKKWLPKAMPVDDALKMLKDYQENSKKIIKLHWAFIEGENDSEEDMALLCHKVRTSGLRVDIAVVRYNPYSDKHGKEPHIDIINRNVEILRTLLPFSKVKIITRVGSDIKASCGQFIEPDGA